MSKKSEGKFVLGALDESKKSAGNADAGSAGDGVIAGAGI